MPLATPDESPQQSGSVLAQAAELRVLIVDDDVVDRATVRRALARSASDVAIVEAGSVAELRRAATGGVFDCVFLDYNIPGSDGLELIRWLRGELPGTPIVMLTGQGDEQVAVELMKAGAVDYLPKDGLTADRIATALRYAVDLSRVEQLARRAEQDLHESVLRARFLAEASAALSNTLILREAISEVVRLATPLLGDCCVVVVADSPTSEGVAASACSPGAPFDSGPELVDRARSAVLASDLAAIRHDSGEVLPVWLEMRRHVLGCLVVFRVAERLPFTAADAELAHDLARRIAAAVDNSRLFEAAQQARQRTERLQRVTASLAAALPLRQVADLFVDQVRDALGAATAWVALANHEAGEFIGLVHGGFADHQIAPWLRFPLDADVPPADSLADGQPRWFRSKQELAQRYPSLAAWTLEVDQEALAILPLDAGAGVFGVMSVGFREQRGFAEDDRSLAVALARQFAQALERARLYEAEHAARDQAEAARAEAEEANRAKSEFLARMSHDLRTPLNAIGGYAEIISMGIHGAVTDAQSEALERIQRAKEHLLTLINDILGFAKLEAGQVSVTITPVSLADLARALRPMIEPQVVAAGLRYEAGGDDVHVAADQERLLQVLLNLLTNAVKFTPEGGRIVVDWTTTGEAVSIRVRDTGKGIPADRLPTIFDPFVQAGRSPAGMHEGVGLGLAISRELLRLMDGRLTADSEVGRGSTFTITLPRA